MVNLVNVCMHEAQAEPASRARKEIIRGHQGGLVQIEPFQAAGRVERQQLVSGRKKVTLNETRVASVPRCREKDED